LTIEAPEPTFNRVVEHHDDRLDALFHALSDRTRRGMLAMLAKQERSVGELAEPFDMSLAAASKHIKTLESAGLVERTIEGRTHVCRLSGDALIEIHRWMRRYEKFWNERLDVLERELRKHAKRGAKR
jgi:DNA-binding transcriptional ArsR family regulator